MNGNQPTDSPIDVVAAARRLQTQRLKLVRDADAARRAWGAQTTALEEATASYRAALDAAHSGGWSSNELHALGLDEPETPRRSRGRPRYAGSTRTSAPGVAALMAESTVPGTTAARPAAVPDASDAPGRISPDGASVD